MKQPMFKHLATDVAPPIAALLAFVVCAMALGYLMQVSGAMQEIQRYGHSLHSKVAPSFPRDDMF
jgi:hypothetical protein